MHRLCEFNPGICLTTEEKARKNLSQGSQRMSQGGQRMYLCIYKTRLAPNEVFSSSNKINRKVGRANDLSAPRYYLVPYCLPLYQMNVIIKGTAVSYSCAVLRMVYRKFIFTFLNTEKGIILPSFLTCSMEHSPS